MCRFHIIFSFFLIPEYQASFFVSFVWSIMIQSSWLVGQFKKAFYIQVKHILINKHSHVKLPGKLNLIKENMFWGFKHVQSSQQSNQQLDCKWKEEVFLKHLDKQAADLVIMLHNPTIPFLAFCFLSVSTKQYDMHSVLAFD